MNHSTLSNRYTGWRLIQIKVTGVAVIDPSHLMTGELSQRTHGGEQRSGQSKAESPNARHSCLTSRHSTGGRHRKARTKQGRGFIKDQKNRAIDHHNGVRKLWEKPRSYISTVSYIRPSTEKKRHTFIIWTKEGERSRSTSAASLG